MRLTSVVIHASETLEDLELSVREGSFGNRYIVRQILGIDAEDVVPKFIGFGAETGVPGYERIKKPIDIVMLIALNPLYTINESISDLRDRFYRLISANRSGFLQLQFKDGGALVSVINGMITRMEVAYFSQTPQLQVTFSCPDPIFRSILPIDYDPAALPTTNPIMLPDNASTAPHGLSFKVEFTASTSEFSIQDAASNPDWFFTITPNSPFDIGDQLWFSSEYGSKMVHLEAGSPEEMMDLVDSGSTWPTIYPGNNTFYFPQIANFDWLEMKYYSAYWGL